MLDSGAEDSLLLGWPDEGLPDGDDDPFSLDEPVAEPLDVGPDELSATDELMPDDDGSTEDDRSADEDRSADDELPPLELGAEELEAGKPLDSALLDGALLDAESDDEVLLPLLLLEEGPELEVAELLLALGPEELAGGPLPLGGPALVDGAELRLELDAEALEDALDDEELGSAEGDVELEDSLLE